MSIAAESHFGRASPARVLVPLGLAIVLSLAGDQTLYATLATQTNVVGISVAAVGVMLGVNRLVRIPGNLLGGLVVDRVGRRAPFVAGMLLGTLSTASYAFAHGFWSLLAGRILWGLAWVLINVSGLSMILDITEPSNRGRITGLYQLAYLLGLAVAATTGGFLVSAFGFHRALLFCAGATGIGLLIGLAALPETASMAGHPRPRWRIPTWKPAALLAITRRKGAAFGAQLDRRVLLVSLMYLITNFVGNGVLMSTVALLLVTRFGDRITIGTRTLEVAAVSGALLGVRAFLGMLSGPVAGHLSDSPRGRWRVISWGFVLGMAGFALLIPQGGLWLIIAGIVLVAISIGTLLPTMAAQAGDLASADHQGTTMGLYATGGDIGSAAGPVVAYAVAAALGLHWAYLGCGILLLMAAGMTIVVSRRSSARLASS